MELTVKSMGLGALYTNCYIVHETGEKGCLVVDPAEFTPIVKYMEEHGLTCERILLTHGHFDHTSGVRALRACSGAPVCLHEEDMDTLVESGKRFSQYVDHPAQPEDIDVVFKGGEDFRFLGHDFHVLHTPGHSTGSVCYVCRGHLFSGDTLFFSTIGRTDFPNSDAEAMKKSLKKLYDLDGDYTVYPGHGKSTMLSRERRVNPFMRPFEKSEEA